MAWMAHAGDCIGLRGSSDSPVKEGREVLGAGSGQSAGQTFLVGGLHCAQAWALLAGS